ARLLPIPDAATKTLTVRLELASDASDWDSFRCWLAKGGAFSALLGPVVGLGLGLTTLAITGSTIGGEAGKAVTDKPAGPGFVKVSGDDEHTVYELKTPLPDLGSTSTIHVATSGPEGVIIAGSLLVIAPAVHAPAFTPPGGTTLPGAWATGFRCSEGQWRAQFELQRIHVLDNVLAVGPR